MGLLAGRFRTDAGGVELGEAAHLTRPQLRCDRAHPLVDVILAHALRKGRELTFSIRALLSLQCRSAELDLIRAVTGGARGNAARRISVEHQPNGGRDFPPEDPLLRAPPGGRPSVWIAW